VVSEVEDFDDVDEQETGGPSRRPPVTPAQRRARRQAVTLLLVAGLLLVSFLFAAAYYGGWFTSPKATPQAGSCPTSTPTATRKVAPSQVHVNVYNASKRNGLAKKVSGELQLQGFLTGKVANDPLRATVTTPAQVRYGPKGKAAAQLVASEVAGSKLVADKRKDASVDLVLGASYSRLIGSTAVSAGSTPTCRPTAGSTTTGSPTTSTKKAA
jgi:hypothetical protein